MNSDSNSGLTLINALCNPGAYDHPIEPVKIIETHISWVLLTGQYVYKIKKPIKFGFLDFSTLPKRRFFCSEEIRLNRRLAPYIYLETVPITGTPDNPKIGRVGRAFEYAVKMNQFAEGQLLSERAEDGELNADLIDQIAGIVADFHNIVEKAGDDSPYGDAQDIKHWFDENIDQIEPLLKEDCSKNQLQAVQQWGGGEWSAKSGLMRLRKQQGYIRECHGDLHLSNITTIDGKITLFDCIEFNPMLRWIDVISDVAFLATDLLYFGYERHAFRFLNHYFESTGDYRGVGLLRYYLVYRALVMAKVVILSIQQRPDKGCKQSWRQYIAYMNLAERFTEKNKTVLIIMHGYSGSGKSTLAGNCAEAIGAFRIRSDIERKRLFGFSAEQKTGSKIDDGIYSQNADERTYLYLADLAKSVVTAGFSVIIDAAFLKMWQRDIFRQTANELAVDYIILDCHASDGELYRRIGQRSYDASEATIEVLQQQQISAQPLASAEMPFVMTIDTERDNALDSWLDCFSDKLR